MNTIADSVASELARASRPSSDTDEGIDVDDVDDAMDDDDDDDDDDVGLGGPVKVRKPDVDAVTGPGPSPGGARRASGGGSRGRRSSNATSKTPSTQLQAPIPTTTQGIIHLSDAHRTLLAALNPLRAVQRNLELRLGTGALDDDSPSSSPGQRTPVEGFDVSGRPLRMVGQGTFAASGQGASGSSSGSGTTSVSFRDITNGPGSGSLSLDAGTNGTNVNDQASGAGAGLSRSLTARRRRSQEFFVHAGGWKSAVLSKLGRRGSVDKENFVSSDSASELAEEKNGLERDAKTIASLRTQMRVLWADRSVREVMKLRGVRLFDSAEL